MVKEIYTFFNIFRFLDTLISLVSCPEGMSPGWMVDHSFALAYLCGLRACFVSSYDFSTLSVHTAITYFFVWKKHCVISSNVKVQRKVSTNRAKLYSSTLGGNRCEVETMPIPIFSW